MAQTNSSPIKRLITKVEGARTSSLISKDECPILCVFPIVRAPKTSLTVLRRRIFSFPSPYESSSLLLPFPLARLSSSFYANDPMKSQRSFLDDGGIGLGQRKRASSRESPGMDGQVSMKLDCDSRTK